MNSQPIEWEKILANHVCDKELISKIYKELFKIIGKSERNQLKTASVQFSHLVVSDSLRPHESQHARPPLFITNSRSSPRLTSIESVMPSSHLILCRPLLLLPQSLLASESFPMSQLFTWGGQSIRVSASASVLPMNTHDGSPLEWTGWISLQAKGLSRVFSNNTVQKHQFFGAQPSSQSNSHIHTWSSERP